MHDILLTTLIVLCGFVPVGIALWYSKKLLLKADNIYEKGKVERGIFEANMKKWLLGEEFSRHMTHVFNGYMGSEVKKIKGSIQDEAIVMGMPPPAKKAIAKGVRGFLEDYGMSPKTAKGAEAVIDTILNRPSKKQTQQQDAMIQQWAQQNPNIAPMLDGPPIDNSLYPQNYSP